MSDTIIAALIGLGGSAIGSFIGVLINTKLTAFRIEQLEKKQDVHNQVIERTFRLEENVKENSHDIVEAKSDIREIKNHLMKG